MVTGGNFICRGGGRPGDLDSSADRQRLSVAGSPCHARRGSCSEPHAEADSQLVGVQTLAGTEQRRDDGVPEDLLVAVA